MTKKKAQWWLESLVRNYGGSVHKEALSVIFTGQGESRPTVRPKRPMQQRKGKILRCTYDGDCSRRDDYGFCDPTQGRCPNQRKTSPIA